MTPQYIRIVAVPQGEAPPWVREKWVGLCLPVVGGPEEAYVSGVLSGPTNRFLAFAWRFLGKLSRQSGYAVYVRDAVSELEKTAPDAAAWWRTYAPQLQAPGRKFIFRTSCCEPLQHACRTSNQIASMIPQANTTLPPAGLSPLSQTPKPVPRISLHRSPFVRAVILALVLIGGIWNWSHPIRLERQTTVHGNLVDWSLHKSNRHRGQTVHLRITGFSQEFRIDPAVFRDLMGDRLPAGFVRGAALDITADASQLAAPFHPPLEPGIAMVWINGLVVNGVTALALKDVLRHERTQWISCFALLAIAAAYLAFSIVSSRKQRAIAQYAK